MDYVKWRDEYYMGDEIIDSQHKKLFMLINALAKTETAKREDVAQAAIKALEEYTIKHFLYEESLLREMHYPQLYAHTDKHAAFVSEIKTYRKAMENGIVPYEEMLHFLTAWLVDHILVNDFRYAVFAHWR